LLIKSILIEKIGSLPSSLGVLQSFAHERREIFPEEKMREEKRRRETMHTPSSVAIWLLISVTKESKSSSEASVGNKIAVCKIQVLKQKKLGYLWETVD